MLSISSEIVTKVNVMALKQTLKKSPKILAKLCNAPLSVLEV